MRSPRWGARASADRYTFYTRCYAVRTKTEAVDLALRYLAGQPMTRDEALAMRGAHAIGATPPDIGP